MSSHVIDLRDLECASCGAPLAIFEYEGDRKMLTCDRCARSVAGAATVDLAAAEAYRERDVGSVRA